MLGLGQQNAVGHQLDIGVGAHPVGETNLVADRAADLAFELGGDAFGQGASRDATRLRMADQPIDPPPEFEANLGKLGGLARTGLAANNDDLVLANRARDLFSTGSDRELFGKVGTGLARSRCARFATPSRTARASLSNSPATCSPRASLRSMAERGVARARAAGHGERELRCLGRGFLSSSSRQGRPSSTRRAQTFSRGRSPCEPTPVFGARVPKRARGGPRRSSSLPTSRLPSSFFGCCHQRTARCAARRAP